MKQGYTSNQIWRFPGARANHLSDLMQVELKLIIRVISFSVTEMEFGHKIC